ncbi:MAG: DoxX family protein [Paracoccaceae bacterium]|nr:DoxX family protein [Paracoccaceae bacterium]
MNVGRFLLAFIFFMSGISKITSYQNTAAWMESERLPGLFSLIVIPLEVLGGIAIIVGWNTRIVTSLLAGFCLLSGILFHGNFSDQGQMAMFMKNLAIAGGFLLLIVHGVGNYSIDARSRNDLADILILL